MAGWDYSHIRGLGAMALKAHRCRKESKDSWPPSLPFTPPRRGIFDSSHVPGHVKCSASLPVCTLFLLWHDLPRNFRVFPWLAHPLFLWPSKWASRCRPFSALSATDCSSHPRLTDSRKLAISREAPDMVRAGRRA